VMNLRVILATMALPILRRPRLPSGVLERSPAAARARVALVAHIGVADVAAPDRLALVS